MEKKIIMGKRLPSHFGSLLAFILFAVTLWALHYELKAYETQYILLYIRSFSSAKLLTVFF